MTMTELRVDVWADIVCPWCYVGEARLERAVEGVTDAQVQVVPHAFELAPGHFHPVKLVDSLAQKFGMSPERAAEADAQIAGLAQAQGLPYTSDRMVANTFTAHRLIAAANAAGCGLEVLRSIQRGHFSGEMDLGDDQAVVQAAIAGGLDAEVAREVAAGDAYAEDVRADEDQARQLGVTGVPFTVIGGRYAIPGAGEVEQYAEGLRRALADAS